MTSPSSTSQNKPLSPDASSIRGRYLWHELLAKDVASALTFYPAVTGWTVMTMPSPLGGETPYTMFARGEAPVAGLMPYPPEAGDGEKPVWLSYIGTPDVDATTSEATALGAKVMMPPTDIPTVGRIAVLTDPQGAAFAIYAPSDAPSPETEPGPGEFAWHDLSAPDPEAALAFYMKLFGWEKTEAMDMGKDGIYQMFGRGGFTYGGMSRRTGPATEAPYWNVYIRVPDLDAAIGAIKLYGGTITMGPHPVPNDDRIISCTDNQGAVISFVGRSKK